MDELKAAYDREESPNLEEYEPNTVASLLKQYLRDLPENLLTKELLPRFEEACGRSSEAEKVQEFQRLLEELPECSRLLISWLIVHMDHVIAKELETKMNIQNISIVLSPTVQVHGLPGTHVGPWGWGEGTSCAESYTKQWTRDSGQGPGLSVAVFFHSVDGVDVKGGKPVDLLAVPVKSEYCSGLGVGLISSS